jgi:hypothetical protein
VTDSGYRDFDVFEDSKPFRIPHDFALDAGRSEQQVHHDSAEVGARRGKPHRSEASYGFLLDKQAL